MYLAINSQERLRIFQSNPTIKEKLHNDQSLADLSLKISLEIYITYT